MNGINAKRKTLQICTQADYDINGIVAHLVREMAQKMDIKWNNQIE